VRGWSGCGSGGPGAPSKRDGTTGDCLPRTDGNYGFTLNRKKLSKIKVWELAYEF